MSKFSPAAAKGRYAPGSRQPFAAISEEPRANGCAAPASGLRRYN